MTQHIITTEHLPPLLSNIPTQNKVATHIQSGICSITEISSGNVNQVFRVQFESGFSCVAKYAPPFAFRYQAISINNDRNAFEVNVLAHFFHANKTYYPEVYYYCEKEHLMLMQDLSTCSDMREALIRGEIFPNFSKQMIEVLSSYPKKPTEIKAGNTSFTFQEGIPELQNITRDFVFQCPFGLKYPEGVVCLPENIEWVKANIFNNEALQETRQYLEELYHKKPETLLHGDLHTGSIMVSESALYIIDPEFSKLGPISFDLGMLIANLVMSYLAAEYHLSNTQKHKHDFQQWLLSCISQIWEESILLLSRQGHHTSELLQESSGYCGIEIIRRTIGNAQIKDFLSISDERKRSAIELEALKLAVWLLEKNKTSDIITHLIKKLMLARQEITIHESSN